MNVDLLEYGARHTRNRETFLLNFGTDFRTFDLAVNDLQNTWGRLGKERDVEGQSHAGLLLFVNILVRHTILGLQHIAAYQSFLGWLTFRPGLEALLILGKFLDDPANAKIWKERHLHRDVYWRVFSGKALASKRLPRSADFRQVLTRLNENFVHPNPDFAYRDMTVRDQDSSVILEIQFFDTVPSIHEAHLLAYVNLIDIICLASESLVNALCGPHSVVQDDRKPFSIAAASRATALASRNSIAKKVMEDLGLWQFSFSD